MQPQQQFKQFLDQRKLKFTKERQQILRAIIELDEPFDVDKLLFYLKQQGEKTSKATIYRMLQLLLESGLLRSICLSPTETHSALYSICSKFRSYDHLVCTGCGKITDVEKERICATCHTIASERSYKLEAHSLRIFALCPECQKNGIRPC